MIDNKNVFQTTNQYTVYPFPIPSNPHWHLVPGTPGTLGRADHVAQRRRAERVRGKAYLWASRMT